MERYTSLVKLLIYYIIIFIINFLYLHNKFQYLIIIFYIYNIVINMSNPIEEQVKTETEKVKNDKRTQTSKDNMAKARKIRLENLKKQKEQAVQPIVQQEYDEESESDSNDSEQEIIIKPSKKTKEKPKKKQKQEPVVESSYASKTDIAELKQLIALTMQKKPKAKKIYVPAPAQQTPAPAQAAPQLAPQQGKNQDLADVIRRKILMDL